MPYATAACCCACALALRCVPALVLEVARCAAALVLRRPAPQWWGCALLDSCWLVLSCELLLTVRLPLPASYVLLDAAQGALHVPLCACGLKLPQALPRHKFIDVAAAVPVTTSVAATGRSATSITMRYLALIHLMHCNMTAYTNGEASSHGTHTGPWQRLWSQSPSRQLDG